MVLTESTEYSVKKWHPDNSGSSRGVFLDQSHVLFFFSFVLMCLLLLISTKSNFISIGFLNSEPYSWGITWHLYLLSPHGSSTKYVPQWTHVDDRLYLNSCKICFGKRIEKHMRNLLIVLFIILGFILETGIYISNYSDNVFPFWGMKNALLRL